MLTPATDIDRGAGQREIRLDELLAQCRIARVEARWMWWSLVDMVSSADAVRRGAMRSNPRTPQVAPRRDLGPWSSTPAAVILGACDPRVSNRGRSDVGGRRRA